jgi:hypothetical protein
MTALIVESGPGRGNFLVLDGAEPILVGSDPGCHLHVPGDGVADRHLVIKALKSGGYGAKCLAGEFELNDESVAVSRLGEGDRIRIGSVELRVAAEAPAARPAAPPPEAEPGAAEPPARRAKAANGELTAGDEIGGFKILGVLGRGGQGIVYRAEQVSLNRQVALKVLSHELTDDPVFVARFQAEARAAARLHHPNVVQVFDVGHEGTTWFYSMEVMGQGSLEDLVKQRGKLSAEEVVTLLQDAARAFEYAESLRIVHRDVKPDNLMLDEHGHVKLVDLGLALTDEVDGGAKVVGSPAFMSPEQALRRAIDHRSDLYSLGCTAYRLLSGKNPFRRATVKEILVAHVKETAEPLHKVEPEVPIELSEVVARLMAKDPGERFQSAAELREALEELTKTPGPNKAVLLGGAAVVLLIAATAVIWALTREKEVVEKTTVVNTGISEEEMAQERERARQLEAEKAFLELRTSGKDGEELAAAYVALAERYPDTEGAARANAEAERIRDAIAAAERAAEERRLAIERNVRTLQDAFASEMQSGDFAAAAAALAIENVQESLRDADEIATARSELQAQLFARTSGIIDDRCAALDGALESAGPTAIRTAAAEVRALYEGDAAWPESILPAPRALELRERVRDALVRAEEIEAERENAAESAAWATLAEGLHGDGDPLPMLLAFHPADAGRRLGELAAKVEGSRAAGRVSRLMPAFEAAEKYVRALREAAGDDGVAMSPPPGVEMAQQTLVDIEEEGGATLLVVRIGEGRDRELRRIRPEFYGTAPSYWFPRVEGVQEADRQAFLALLALAHHVQAARKFVGGLDPTNIASGTGEGSFDLWTDDLIAIGDWLLGKQEGLRDGSGVAAWRIVLAEELQAARRLTQGLAALADQRDLAAARAFGQLQREQPNSFAALSL